MTRIVTNTTSRMEQSEASLEFFFIQLFGMNVVFSLSSLVYCLCSKNTSTFGFVVWSVLTLKKSRGNAFNICVELSLITLTVWKLHFCFYYIMFKGITSDTFIMCMAFTILFLSTNYYIIKVKMKY